MLAQTQIAGLTLSSLLLAGGRKLVRNDIKRDVSRCSSFHTLSHVNCSNAGLVVILKMESFESELSFLISLFTSLHKTDTTSFLNDLFSTIATAMECLFP